MPLPSSGLISLADIQTEFGGVNPIGINEYYRNGGLVSSNNTNVPTSGTISLANFYGARKQVLVPVVLDFPDGSPFSNPEWTNNYNNTFGYWTMPSNILNNTLNITAIGAGAGAPRLSAAAGGDYVTRTVVLSPGTQIRVITGQFGVADAGVTQDRPYGGPSGVLQWDIAYQNQYPFYRFGQYTPVLVPNRICWAVGGFNNLGSRSPYSFGDYIEQGSVWSGTGGGGAGNCGPIISGQGGIGKNLNGTCGGRGFFTDGGIYGGGGGYFFNGVGADRGGAGGTGAVRISFTSIQ